MSEKEGTSGKPLSAQIRSTASGDWERWGGAHWGKKATGGGEKKTLIPSREENGANLDR